MPRPHAFRLERVRALRERVEDRAKEDLAASLALRLRREAILRAAGQQLDAAEAETRATVASGPVSGESLLALQAYRERLERSTEAASLDLDRQDAEVQARRTALEAAARDRKVLERLAERSRAAHQREVARAEGAALDEVAIAGHRRREAA